MVLAYRYTTILSAQLISFWTIVVVVIISFLFLRVRYRIPQILGILICCGGMGVLLASDSMNGSPVGGLPTQVKGDLFMLLGATMYGFSNVAEEFLASKKPLFEVIGQLAFWGMLINGTQAGIFDRASFRSATWNGKVAGYMVGYTLTMLIFCKHANRPTSPNSSTNKCMIQQTALCQSFYAWPQRPSLIFPS